MEKFTSQTTISRRGAEFEGRESFNSHSTVVDACADRLEYTGLPLDWLEDGQYATSSAEQHCMIVGDTGCGKTRRLIIPTIRLMSKTKQSMVISDPKGELYQKTAAGLLARGYNVRVLNMREPRCGNRWNPFTLIEKYYRSDDQMKKDKALLMLDEILEIMRLSNHSEKDPYWEQSAIQFLKSIALTILEYGKEGDLSFHNLVTAESYVARWMRNPSYSDSDEASEFFSDDSSEECVFFKFIRLLDRTSAIFQNFQSTLEVREASNTLGCIVSVAQNMVSQYARQEAVQYLFSASDFDIEEIGVLPTAVFMVIPDDSEALYPLATLFVDQVYSSMIELAYQIGGKTQNPVNFVLDEFANFTRLPKIRSMLTASRSRGIRFFFVVQDVDQLEERYGEFSTSTIMSNCHVWVYMGCRNLKFLRTLREISGYRYEKYTGDSYPLLGINDLLTLQTGETIVWNKGCNPKRCWLPDYSEVPFSFGKENEIKECDFPAPDYSSSIESIDFTDIIKNAVRILSGEDEEEEEDDDFLFDNEEDNIIPF